MSFCYESIMKIQNFFTLRLVLNAIGAITIILTVTEALNGRTALWRNIFLEDTMVIQTLVEGNPPLFFVGVIIWLILGISMFFLPAQKNQTFKMRYQAIIQKIKKR